MWTIGALMASAFAHAVAGGALWPLFRTPRAPRATWVLGATLAILPDLDVIGFRYGVPYAAPLGHRGLTHSLLIAIVVGAGVAWVMTRRWELRSDRLRMAGYFTAALASHGLLDAMTSGGLGVALLAPITNARYFFPWRPIAVSPIGIRPFFTQRGLAILANEALWVGVPSLLIAWIGTRINRLTRNPV